MSKIFCIGLSKTGTKSISRALDVLGYNGRHYIDPSRYLKQLLTESLDGFHWGTIIGNDHYASDIPIPKYFKQLDKQFPNSKFILTKRASKEAWLDSCRHQFKSVLANLKGNSYNNSNFTIDAHSVVRLLQYGIIQYDAKTLSDYYDDHVHLVKEYFKNTDKLLEFDMTQGDSWDKLCTFLNKDIPNKPFPWVGGRKK